MADSVVSFLLENTIRWLIQESELQGGVKDKVKSLENELSLINVFLDDTEGKRHDNKLVKKVVSQIRDVAYEAEDVIDTFIIAVTKHRRKSMLGKFIHSGGQAISFHQVANKIESIKIINREINDNRSTYCIEIAESSGGDAQAEKILHGRRKDVEEDQVVGFTHDTEDLVKRLIEGSSQRNVVSITGMGGLGKTTLARKIYNNNDVQNFFDFRGWVYVSHEYEIRKLLLEILKGVTPKPKLKKYVLEAELKEELFHHLEAKYSSSKDKLKGTPIEDLNNIKAMNDEECRKALFAFLEHIEDHKLRKSLSVFVEGIYKKNGERWLDLDEDELRSLLFDCLKDKRYLVVIDDIWEIKQWNEVSAAFPNNLNGSRILITSRSKKVASLDNSVPPIHPYELQLLNEEESWELFCKKVFHGGTCLPELENLGRQLVKSCHGLPLAIVVLGGLLASEDKTHRIWTKYIGHVSSYLTEEKFSCRDILALSYHHLPRHLKPCFLYFGIYPEDFEIPVRQLIRLWIAEGFIRQIGNRNLEDIAEDYLEDLINRSLIQVATKRLDGGVKTCHIHDLLRDLCISESSEEKFLEVHSNVNFSPVGKSRRISVHYGNNPYISSSPCKPSNSRSVIVFSRVVKHEFPLDKSYLKWICKGNKLVRVVELSNMGIHCLIPKGIEKLVLLRYLCISSGELHDIPNSICNLWNLETLDMRNTTIACLPKGIWKLQKLRHLYLNGRTYLPGTDNEVTLPNLEVLTGIVLNQETESLFAKARFPNQRKLGLCASAVSGLITLSLPSIHSLRHLQTLKICKYIELSNLSSLQLTLTKITFQNVRGHSPSMWRVLGSLTNLRILKVVDCSSFTLYCYKSSFCQLEVFKIARVTKINWGMEKGTMPRLQRLVLERCKFCIMPLDELWCLSALRDVEVLHPDPKLAKRLQQLQMRDGCKLQVHPPLDPLPTTN